LNSHFLLLQSHTKAIKQLEKELAEYKKVIKEMSVVTAENNIVNPIKRPNEPTNRLNATNQPVNTVPVNSPLSLQEKRILMVLFDNNGLSLSYKDIAKLLNKSPNTVKAQINQLKVKTNLLKEISDSEGTKRYGLKERVKFEKFVG